MKRFVELLDRAWMGFKRVHSSVRKLAKKRGCERTNRSSAVEDCGSGMSGQQMAQGDNAIPSVN